MRSKDLLGIAWAAGIAVALVGCGGQTPRASILSDETFVAVPRGLSAAQTSQLNRRAVHAGVSPALSSGESFYLAIKRSELSKRYFLSAYVKQFHPDGVLGGAAAQVGTRVVSFKLQNDKLFMFDVADIHKTSDAFDPQLVLEAWPVVTGVKDFDDDPKSRGFVLIDPSAGLNRFSLIAEFYFGPPKLQIEISYLQAFKKLGDGVSFEQVFTGEATVPIHDFSGGEFNLLRLSGTLGISLRSYSEGQGFTQKILPDGSPVFYFMSDPRIVPNAGFSEETPAKWNIAAGMKPIVWTISADVQKLKHDPFYGRYDIEGAIRKGIENWNSVFAFTALKAVVGGPDATPGDDVTNYLYVDVNPAVGFAFADWRTNPNTGEIRGASVYFNTLFIDGAAAEFDPGAFGATPSVRALLQGAQAKPTFRLSWAGISDETLCTMPAHPLLGEDLAGLLDAELSAQSGTAAAPTGKELVERVITHVILHEIGHTLGLRHNFKGSMLPPSSSTMDYLFDEDGIFLDVPGSFDVDAIKYLYGISANPPAQPFCNDSGTTFDPDCTRFDRGAIPLTDYWIPRYNRIAGAFLSDPFNNGQPSAYTLNSLLAYVRAGSSPAVRNGAFDAAFAPITGTAALSDPTGVVNFWANFVQRRLFLDGASARTSAANSLVNDPPVATSSSMRARVMAQEGGYLRNTNTISSFLTRRTSVDILKKVQVLDAYTELVNARASIVATGATDLSTQDLLSRIDHATNPYFQ
jgi:hypothetical protein